MTSVAVWACFAFATRPRTVTSTAARSYAFPRVSARATTKRFTTFGSSSRPTALPLRPTKTWSLSDGCCTTSASARRSSAPTIRCRCSRRTSSTWSTSKRRPTSEGLHSFQAIRAYLSPVTGFAAGLVADIRRKLPFYASDFIDGFNVKSLATILFLFFACLAPSIAFGGLLAFLTDGEIGAVEALLATAIGGVVYALLSGQPLTLLGSTGPVTIFLALLYLLCKQLGVAFLPGLFWIGIWTARDHVGPGRHQRQSLHPTLHALHRRDFRSADRADLHHRSLPRHFWRHLRLRGGDER